ncbi:hypothetical protein Cs7R123_08400 [Catellatospora sp. TT07R-123]|uniref:SigE family RNA polymerase sigma factor n=1 Tax=Catellatospora sp. TT07R-123 TaxID=2733863 RepID=UPI001AFE9990|nr:SigE family RNA polymerase sigma factor [Catellatospora sp. TT07R-123]GHJ43498.1 hypothetical protein Cs7R123_08400 [Catellatospora sp. TT07R-123]
MTDLASFDEFVTARSGHLLRVAHLLTGDHAHAEDLLQTALAKSWTAWRRIEGDPEPYVRRVLANTFNSWWRRRWHAERPTEHLPELPTPAPHAAIEERDRVWRALARLPRQQRVVLVLRYFEDLSEADIAAALNISAGSVKTHASKGLAKLRLDPTLLASAEFVGAPANNQRLAAVRDRVARNRRRKVGAIVAVCVGLALLAAYALVPQLGRRALPEPAFPIKLGQYQQVSQEDRDGPVNADYYHLGPTAQHNYAARIERALVWTPGDRTEALFVACRQHGASLPEVVAFVDGQQVSQGPCGNVELPPGIFRTVLDAHALNLSPTRQSTVSIVLRWNTPGRQTDEGTVAVAIGAAVSFEEIPLVAVTPSADRLEHELRPHIDPAKVTWLYADGPHSVTLTWRGPMYARAQVQTSGRLRLSVDGKLLATADFGTSQTLAEVEPSGGVVMVTHLGPTTITLGSAYSFRNGDRFDPALGSTITISIDADRMPGDWYVAIYPAGG